MKVVIIGGVAAGAAAAARLGREKKDAEIIIFEKSSKISFSNCGLPYGIGKVANVDDLAPSDFSYLESLNVKVNVFSEVTQINNKEKTILVKNTKTGEVVEHSYDKLVVTPGARAAKLEVKGMEDEKDVFPLRTFDDMQFIIKKIKNKTKALILGGGYIGVEVAEALQGLGMTVHLVEPRSKLAGFDYDFSSFLDEKLRNNNINLHFGEFIEKIDAKAKKFTFKGEEFGYDFIITTGTTPNTEIFKGSTIKVDSMGLVDTNRFMQTSDKDVYAAGDIVKTPHVYNDKKIYMPMAFMAKSQGRVIADHLAGVKTKGQIKTTGVSGLKVFGQEFAKAGFSEAMTKVFEIPHRIVMASVYSNASYLSKEKITMKMIIHARTYKLIGLQAFGKNATKAVDTFATALTAGMDVYDLASLNLVYQPHLSTTTNPLNSIAQVAINEIRIGFSSVCPAAIPYEEQPNMIIDVRTPEQYKEGHAANAMNIELSKLSIGTVGFDLNKSIILFCNSGFSAAIGARKLRDLGYTNVRVAYGGYNMDKLIQKK